MKRTLIMLYMFIITALFITACESKKEVEGCTDSAANNYNEDATVDDESCTYDDDGDDDGNDDGGPPECATDCDGFEEDGDSNDGNVFCQWFVDTYQDGEGECMSDCTEELEALETMNAACVGCLDDDTINCDDIIDDDGDDGDDGAVA